MENYKFSCTRSSYERVPLQLCPHKIITSQNRSLKFILAASPPTHQSRRQYKWTGLDF